MDEVVPPGEDDEAGDVVENGATAAAPFDPVIAERLDEPSSPEALYLEEAIWYRPLSTGDIFQCVPVPGATADEASGGLTILIAHPSVMRKGAYLEPRVRAASVMPLNGMSRRKWSKGFFDVFPLPLLATVGAANGFTIEDRGWAALLQPAGPIETAALDPRKRVACLSPEGVHILLQRLVHSDTRVAVRLDSLAAMFQAKLEELEMLQTWNETFVGAEVDSGGLDQLLEEAARFEEVMNRTDGDRPVSIRAMLESRCSPGEVSRAGEAHRLFAAEMRDRQAA